MSGYDIEEKLAAYLAVCRRGTDWLLALMKILMGISAPFGSV